MTQSIGAGNPQIQQVLVKRSVILFINFLLIILAYYQVKAASRSLLIEYWGAANFPYVWIISALTLGTFIGFYHRLVERHSRFRIVLGSLLLFIILLVGFWLLLDVAPTAASFGFYIFIDIFSVILVEQFWSLANTVSSQDDGKRSYWFVATGGLVGGVLGGQLSAQLLSLTELQTPDLLLTCAAFLGVTLVMNLGMGRMGLYREIEVEGSRVVTGEGWRALLGSRYLLLIAAALFCAQLAQPVVEFQFISAVETAYSDREARSIFFGHFFSVLGLVAIGVNIVLTPIIHRYLGVIAGMLTQPFVLAASTCGFFLQPTLMVASAMKIADRGLSYSINRASKEQLYIPVDPVRTYQAKAWIDMLGYRLFRVAGATAILALTQWLPLDITAPDLGWMTLLICAAWIAVVAMLAREYNTFSLRTAAA